MGGSISKEDIDRIVEEKIRQEKQSHKAELQKLQADQQQKLQDEIKKADAVRQEERAELQKLQRRLEEQKQQDAETEKKIEAVRQEERAELQKLQQRLEEQKQQDAETEKIFEAVRQEELRTEIQKLEQKFEQQQKEINERVKREEVHGMVKDETSQQLQHMAIENEKTKDELMKLMQDMTKMNIQVLTAVDGIQKSSGTQEKLLDDVKKRMATNTGVQAIINEKLHAQASQNPHQMVEYNHSHDPQLNSTPNTQTGMDSLCDSLGRPPDDVSMSRVYSLQVYEAPTSDESIESEEPGIKRHANPTALLATVGGTEHDDHQPKPHRRGPGLVAHSMQLQYTKASWNADS